MEKFIKSTRLRLLILASLILSCSKKENSPLYKLTFDLVILNEDGEKSNVLKEGEDFSIGFEVINHSQESIFISHEDGRKLYRHFYKQRNFLAIYRNESEEDGQEDVFVGKPYDPSIDLDFTDNLLPGYFIDIAPSDRQYVFLIPWTRNSANQAIRSGNYYSSFQDTVLLEGVEIPIDTKIEFEVN